jgi:hypothetical protein
MKYLIARRNALLAQSSHTPLTSAEVLELMGLEDILSS